MSQKLNLDLNAAIGLPQYDTPFLRADWPAPAQVKTLLTTRKGGVSRAPFAGLNVGAHVGDAPADVAHNRALVAAEAGRPVAYLNQIHSPDVVEAAQSVHTEADADAAVDRSGAAACSQRAIAAFHRSAKRA